MPFNISLCLFKVLTILLLHSLLFHVNFSNSNGGTGDGYNIGEKEQWCLTTLGYVKAFSRQYASEVRLC